MKVDTGGDPNVAWENFTYSALDWFVMASRAWSSGDPDGAGAGESNDNGSGQRVSCGCLDPSINTLPSLTTLTDVSVKMTEQPCRVRRACPHND